eukprot:scaffold54538_cov66-Cyclotella_meneghiniana.AAC.2
MSRPRWPGHGWPREALTFPMLVDFSLLRTRLFCQSQAILSPKASGLFTQTLTQKQGLSIKLFSHAKGESSDSENASGPPTQSHRKSCRPARGKHDAKLRKSPILNSNRN